MSTKPKLKLKKMKDFPNILHIDSNLVLTSLEDKTVIGKYENLKIVLLNKSDIDLCNQWKLVYDPEKINDKHEEDNDQEEVDDDLHDEDKEEEEEDKEEENKDKEEENKDKEEEENIEEHTSSNNVPNSKHILDIATQFTKDIHNHFDLLTDFYTEKIINYENKISTMDIEYNNLLLKYNSECEVHSNTKEDLKKLQSKFEGIKSLFN